MFIVDVLASPNRVNARIVALGAVHIDSKPICPVLRPAKTFSIALGISMYVKMMSLISQANTKKNRPTISFSTLPTRGVTRRGRRTVLRLIITDKKVARMTGIQSAEDAIEANPSPTIPWLAITFIAAVVPSSIMASRILPARTALRINRAPLSTLNTLEPALSSNSLHEVKEA